MTDPERLARTRNALLQERLLIRSRTSGAATSLRRIPRRQDGRAARLSASQRQLWFLSQVAPASTAYNELATLRRTGPIDLDALRGAFSDFVQRHEAWRTSFVVVDGEPRQIVHEAPQFALPLIDLSDLAPAVAEQRAAELAVEEVRRPYDLVRGPLVRPHLVKVTSNDHRLYLGLHHLIFDGVTLYQILLPEITALYAARVAGRAARLREPLVQYPDYAEWEADWAESPAVSERVAWWRDHLEGLRPLELPLDHPRPARPRFAGGAVSVALPEATVVSLREFGRRNGASLFQVLATCYAWWLAQYTGKDDLAFATMTDLRRLPELTEMAGYCLAPVVIRVDLSGRATLGQLLEQVRGAVLDAMDHAVPFERLVRDLGAERDPRLNPIFQASLVLEPPMVVPDRHWSVHQMEVVSATGSVSSKFDLSIELDERPDGHLEGRLIYDADLFDRGSAEMMAEYWVRLLNLLADDCERPLDTLELAGPLSSGPTIIADADAAAGAPDECVHELVRQQAARTPDAVAVVAADRTLTYRELIAEAEEVAGRLRTHGAGPGTVVAALLDRSVHLVTGLLGILMSGAAYVPLDPRQPRSRLEFLLADVGPTAVLACTALATRIPDVGLPVVIINEPSGSSVPADLPLSVCTPTDLAYVIYTSGSTGRPKGVQVEHRSVAHLMTSLSARLGLTASDVALCVASYVFDQSVGCIFSTLGSGATLVLASTEQATDPRRLAEVIRDREVTFLTATPTTWSALAHAGWSGSPRLTAVSGGETLTESLAATLLELCPRVFNIYGPTEATDVAACGPVRARESVTAGRPLTGVRVDVVDRHGRPTPPGVPGEIVIGGPGVARGYVNRPEEESSRFVDHQSNRPGRIYRTGDRGRVLRDGRVQVLERLDQQIKVRGHRIEPGEIESVMLEHPAITAAAVVVRDSPSGDRHLVGYVVGTANVFDDGRVRSWLRDRLPDHLVPGVFVQMNLLPTTTSGKLDRAALPAPGEVAAVVRPHRAPTTLTQKRLVALWSEALGLRIDDVDLNFFDLGGHSLLAARLVRRVEEVFETDVSLADFLERGTTVAGLAELVDAPPRADVVRGPGSAAPTGREGAGAALYFVYPDPVTAMSLRHLRRAWGSQQAVHPLLVGSTRGWAGRHRSVEQRATQLIESLRRDQPSGPYALAGYSFGGLVAYEMARQLIDTGRQVSWLGIVDTPVPTLSTEVLRQNFSLVARVARQRERSRREQLAKFREVVGRVLRRVPGRSGLAAWRTDDINEKVALALARRHTRLSHDVETHLFVTSDSVDKIGRPDLGWQHWHRGPLHVIALPTDHAGLLQPPHVDTLAELLLACLRRAGRRETRVR